MSYTTGTTHYNLPQTVGSDKRDWTDTNEAFSDVDAALWEAHQGATQAALDIASINSEIQTITGKQADDEADIATISGKVSTLETTVANHTTEIGDVRRDLQDNIESLREDTATSTHAYEIGDYFYYNDVLFKATAQIAIGATIVPNTNCTGVTVMDELKNGGAGSVAAEDVSFDNTASGLTATDVQAAIDEVNAKIVSTEEANDLGAHVDIRSYSTFANCFEIPADGYIAAGGSSSGNASIKIYGSGATAETDSFIYLIAPQGLEVAVFVRKGMKAFVTAVWQPNKYEFTPLV